jgi:ubiquinone/menaquinone biosynthesis C-methylase UbiE
MNEAEFDKFADEYNAMHAAGIAMSGEGPAYFADYKIADIARVWRQREGGASKSASGLQLLDFGAGIGASVPHVQKHLAGADLTCLDLSKRSLNLAEKRFPSLARYVHFDGASIPFPDSHFDIAFAMCVFHHIDHGLHESLLQELRRVIRPGGDLFVYEHNPYNPLTVKVVKSCPIDENAHLIRGTEMKRRTLRAGFGSARTRYRVFFPHFLRSLRPIEHALTWLPLGGQYCVHAVK